MSNSPLIEVRIQQKTSAEQFPVPKGNFEFLVLPRVGEFIHATNDKGEDLFGRVVSVDHFAEAKPPYSSGADVLLTIEIEE